MESTNINTNTTQQNTIGVQRGGRVRDPEEFLTTQKDKLRTLAESFESLLTNEIFKSMRKISFSGDDEDGMFKKTQEEKIFTSMLDAEIADMASHKNPYGLSEMVYKSLEPTLEGWHENRTNQLKNAGVLPKDTPTNSNNSTEGVDENLPSGENKLNNNMLTDQFLGLSTTIQDLKSQNFNDKALDKKVF